MPAGRNLFVLLLLLVLGLSSCGGGEDLRPLTRCVPLAEDQSSSQERTRTAGTTSNGSRELQFYASLIERYESTGDLVTQACRRLQQARKHLRSLDPEPAQLAELDSQLGWFEEQVADAARRHLAATPHARTVGRAVASGSKEARTDESYQALHDAVTENLFAIGEIGAILGNTLQLCRADTPSVGTCDKRVVSILQPLVDLSDRARGLLTPGKGPRS